MQKGTITNSSLHGPNLFVIMVGVVDIGRWCVSTQFLKGTYECTESVAWSDEILTSRLQLEGLRQGFPAECIPFECRIGGKIQSFSPKGFTIVPKLAAFSTGDLPIGEVSRHETGEVGKTSSSTEGFSETSVLSHIPLADHHGLGSSKGEPDQPRFNYINR